MQTISSLKVQLNDKAVVGRTELGKTQRNSVSIVKPTRCTISQIYFILEQHSTCFGLSVHHQESKTVQTESGICHTGSVAA